MRHAPVAAARRSNYRLEGSAAADGGADHLKLVLDRLPIVLWSATPDGRITSCEGHGLSLLQHTSREVVGTSIFDFMRETVETKALLDHVLSTGESVRGTRRVGDRWHEFHVSPQRGTDGNIVSLLGVSLDVTERRQAGQARRESEDRLRAILAHAPMILWAVDRDGRIALVEGKGVAALGLTPEKIVGQPMSTVLPEDQVQLFRAVIAGSSFEGELQTQNLHYDTRCEPLYDAGGASAGAIAVSVDITARKLAEQERDRLLRAARRALLGERAARRRAMFLAQASRVLAGSLDQKTTLLSIGRLVVPEIVDGCAILGVDTDEPIIAFRDPKLEPEVAESIRRIPRGPDTVIGRILRGGEPFFEPRIDTAATAKAITTSARSVIEELGLVSVAMVAMKARGRILGVMTLFTVAESGRELEHDDLELAVDLAVHAALAIDNARLYGEQTLAVQRRDEFLSVASHELRTPVTSVQLAIQAIARIQERSEPAASPPETIATMLQTAERQSKRLARLVENLLDVSRIATGQLTLHLDRVDLAELARESVASLLVEANQAGCPLEVVAPAPAIGAWDRVRLEQVVVNLVSNALKYGRGKPVLLSVETTGTMARLRVEDHGIGIPRAAQETIFDRFERAVSARHYGGFGLGLYIVKQIVTALGGNITVQSEPGEGAAFTVLLPLADPPSTASER